MVLDATLLNTQHYKVSIKGKVEIQRKELHLPVHLGVVPTEKRIYGSPLTTVANFTYFYKERLCNFCFSKKIFN